MKKAMSPLVSTIILIGFAIALGGIVMSWGMSSYTPEKEVGCQQTSLSLIDYNNGKGVCNKEDRVYFTIQNNGEIKLDGIKVILLGDNEIYSTIINKEINVADVVRLDVQYIDIGKIEKVMFVPKFVYQNQEGLCPKNGFSVDKIEGC